LEIATIGFTKRSAQDFFGQLSRAGIQRLIDVRIHPGSQLSAFTKRSDLPYFLRELVGVTYEWLPSLAPTEELLRSYRRKETTWDEYSRDYLELIRHRGVEAQVSRMGFESLRTALLCSEHDASRCHRRLAAEYLADCWGDVIIKHL
jgi:uncharacterized protein (DUF488 family)